MTDTSFPADWQIPAHDAVVLAERRHDHVLVIPVINEGERIRGQLRRVAEAQLPVDVVVADGGSTDGSLDLDFLRGVGVRALLTKTGPGKLSAQLRMAYGWCLAQGYAGIVTIDGNGKDGVDAVRTMVEKLEAASTMSRDRATPPAASPRIRRWSAPSPIAASTPRCSAWRRVSATATRPTAFAPIPAAICSIRASRRSATSSCATNCCSTSRPAPTS